MKLVIDVGNTQIKLAVFKKDQIIERKRVVCSLFSQEVKQLFGKFPGIESAILSTVSNFNEEYIQLIKMHCSLLVLSHKTKMPLTIAYKTPETLGLDRISLALAAYFEYPKENVLVIDAGTCITYDFVNDVGQYLGGSISLGLQMRYKALNNQTAKLPLLKPAENFQLIGDSSEASIQSGVQNGLFLEIEGIVAQYRCIYKDLTVILTGGDAHFLSKRLKNTIFADSDFLLRGLYRLLEHNKG